jgi:hypothetical protein
MKIARIEQFFPRPRMRLVKITTSDGIVGWGESTLEGKPKSVMAAIEELSDYLLDKDPLRIEHHWQHIYRSAFFRGGNVLMSALSGIDHRGGAGTVTGAATRLHVVHPGDARARHPARSRDHRVGPLG